MTTARAVVDTGALKANFDVVRRHAGKARIMAVVKADAYGHGAATVARALSDADAFAVARVREGAALRASGCERRIVVLGGPLDDEHLAVARRDALDLVVHTTEQVALLERWRGRGTIGVWLKHDSGMHRLGFSTDRLAPALARLSDCACVDPGIRLMTHLACADDADGGFTDVQLETFSRACPDVTLERSIANSAAILSRPDTQADWVRPGLMLYGVSPFPERSAAELGLTPVMTLSSRILAIRTVRSGDSVGYGATWTAGRDTRVATIAIGYGDGYPWRAANGGEVLVAGTRRPIVGRVSMDMLAVDLGELDPVRVGDDIVLWGNGLPVEEVARHAGTIPYEVLCSVSRRVRIDPV